VYRPARLALATNVRTRLDWDQLTRYATNPVVLRALLESTVDLTEVSDDDLVAAAQDALAPPPSEEERQEKLRAWDPIELRVPEWDYLQKPTLFAQQENTSGLMVTEMPIGGRLPKQVQRVIAVNRMKKVNAIIGSHLARLLCEPASLPVTDMRPPARFYDPNLNDEQRAAVTGAIGTPHAYFIQGPPGTGKTTVITEVVRHLLARRERVLLLAPMHVAVDEVLGRIADQPGVLALRMSWDEAKVAPDLRKYLPEQASRTYLRQARRPQASQASRWHDEMTALQRQAQAVAAYLEAREAQRRAADELAAAQRAHTELRDRITATLVQGDADANTAQRALGQLAPHLAAAASQAATLRAQLDAVPLVRRAWSALRRAFGAPDEVGQLAATHRQAADYHRRLLADQRAWTAAHADARGRIARAHAEWASQDPAHQDGIRQRRDRLAAAAEGVDAGADHVRTLTGDDHTTTPDADLTTWRDRLRHEANRRQQRIALERRWFELSGLSSGSEDTIAKQVDADLRRCANLICCTTTGVTRDLGEIDFDTLIVDEASRVVDSEFLMGAIRARRWVLVGDEHQLPPYVEPADEHHLHALSALHLAGRGPGSDVDTAVSRLGSLWIEDEELHQFRAETVMRTAKTLRDTGVWQRAYRTSFDSAWRQLRNLGGEAEKNLLSAMRDQLVRSLFERTVTEVPPALRQPLRVQRRMIEPIAVLVREPVYHGAYETPEPCEVVALRYGPTKTPVVFVDTTAHGRRAKDRQVGNGVVNDLEVELVAKMCRAWESRLRRSGAEPVTVSILTFYRAQASQIRSALGGPPYREFRLLTFKVIDAIDKIQGQESDLVFISFCRAHMGHPSAQYGRWLQDVRRLNVACTRARRGLILVGHARTLRRLNGVPAAQAFYRNLFEQFAARPADMQIVPDAG
jgi:AAA domain